jgi:hypothetical protein
MYPKGSCKMAELSNKPKKGLTVLRMANTISVTLCFVNAIVDFAQTRARAGVYRKELQWLLSL